MIATTTVRALVISLAFTTAAFAQTASETTVAPAAAGQATDTAAPTVPGMDLVPEQMENGRWYNAEGVPTFKVQDGEVDYATFSGYRRYHAECHVCHGPDGEGSTYAPALKNSVVDGMDYYEYQEIVASGKKDVGKAANLVMPAFGTNRNVWCYSDDIYVYLLARGTNSIPRGRPANKASKSDEFAAQEATCMDG